MAYKFSPSSLRLLDECKCCFWLHFNKNIKRPSTIFPSLPNGIDLTLKKHFDSHMKNGSIPPAIRVLGLEGVKLFEDEELLKVWRSNFKGIQWTDEHGNLIRGAVDNILRKGKKLIVLDYKTRGFPLKDTTHYHYQDQMDIYNFLLRKNGYPTEDYSYLLFYYPNGVKDSGEILFQTDLVKLDVSIKNAERIFKEAVEVLSGDVPDPDETCGFCTWKAYEI